MQTEINFVLGNNEAIGLVSSLGGRLIVVVSKRDEMLAVFEGFKI